MKLSEFKSIVNNLDTLQFSLPNGDSVPSHYHVTEVGYITKNFIDCGGTLREEKVVNFQLWYSDDVDHRLETQKMLDIIHLAESKLAIEDFEIEVEYQSDTIGKYGLQYIDNVFRLTTKMTDCLAPDKCIIPEGKNKLNLADLTVQSSCCTPNGGCC
jgi:hypothetical protein